MKTTYGDSRLLTGGLWGLVLRYSFPSVASMIGISLYILADTYFIANGVGELGLAALNISMPIYSLLGGIGYMVGIGGATVFSIARESGDEATRRDIFTFCIGLVLAASIAFFLAGACFAGEVSLAFGASPATLPYAETYIRMLLLFAPAFVVNNVVTSFVRNDGAPSLAMGAMLSSVLFNIVFDYVFIYRFGWGMFGAVFATCLSPLVGLSVLSAHFLKRRNTFALRRIRPHTHLLLRVLRGGTATFVLELATGVVILGFNFKLLGTIGDVGVAAYGVISNIAYVMFAIFNGLGQGIQPIASANFGAGRTDRCRELLRDASLLALVLSLLLVAAVMLFPAEIADLFNRDGNAELARIAEQGIRLYFISFLFGGVNIVVIAWYQATLASRTAVAVSLTRGLFGVLVGLAVLPPLLGADGIWLTAPFAEALASLLLLAAVLRRRNAA